ncbi:MAG: ADP-ribosylglycohydrolase family protein [Deltaproteobacteria bacterium]|nr:ADP-ribosylglycohydrolase family protein [Deltaproteobacteria bacterium]
MEETLIRAINDTKDNDTIGAVPGAAVGALHGKSAIPEKWIKNLSARTSFSDDGRIFDLLIGAKSLWG